MENEVTYMSLYEYLGKRAGMELGKQVFQESKRQRVRVQTKEINQGGYSGKVMVYPISFLQEYFSLPYVNGTNTTGNVNNYQTY